MARERCRLDRWALLLALLPSLARGALEAPSGVNRNSGYYLSLGRRQAKIKNLGVEAPGCNVGVNCASRTGRCGKLAATGATIAGPGQLVSDRICTTREPPLAFFEVYHNQSGTCGLTCSMIANTGSGSDCSGPFLAPIIDNLDGDGQPSCANCTSDPGDIAAACGVTVPMAPCIPGNSIIVNENQDCGNNDSMPGNSRCDLAAGTYGTVIVEPGG